MAFTLFLERLSTMTDYDEINEFIESVSFSDEITNTEYEILYSIALDKCR